MGEDSGRSGGRKRERGVGLGLLIRGVAMRCCFIRM